MVGCVYKIQGLFRGEASLEIYWCQHYLISMSSILLTGTSEWGTQSRPTPHDGPARKKSIRMNRLGRAEQLCDGQLRAKQLYKANRSTTPRQTTI